MKITILATKYSQPDSLIDLLETLRKCSDLWDSLEDSKPGKELDITLASPFPGTIQLGEYINITPTHSVEDIQRTDVLILPAIELQNAAPLFVHSHLEHWIQTLHAQKTRIISVGTGSFVLAHIGMLEARNATTHWGYRHMFHTLFPEVQYSRNKSAVTDANITTTGSGNSWHKPLLNLLMENYNVPFANMCENMFLASYQNSSSSFHGEFNGEECEDEQINKAKQWLAEHYTEQNLETRCALELGLSEKDLKTRFHLLKGIPPMDYVQKYRLEHAKKELSLTNNHTALIANNAGYSSEKMFNTMFKAKTGQTPKEYREKLFSRQNFKDKKPQRNIQQQKVPNPTGYTLSGNKGF